MKNMIGIAVITIVALLAINSLVAEPESPATSQLGENAAPTREESPSELNKIVTSAGSALEEAAKTTEKYAAEAEDEAIRAAEELEKATKDASEKADEVAEKADEESKNAYEAVKDALPAAGVSKTDSQQ